MQKEYHFIEEIREQPDALRRSLAAADADLRDLALRFAPQVDRVILENQFHLTFLFAPCRQDVL
jgi:hypothetical protein